MVLASYPIYLGEPTCGWAFPNSLGGVTCRLPNPTPARGGAAAGLGGDRDVLLPATALWRMPAPPHACHLLPLWPGGMGGVEEPATACPTPPALELLPLMPFSPIDGAVVMV